MRMVESDYLHPKIIPASKLYEMSEGEEPIYSKEVPNQATAVDYTVEELQVLPEVKKLRSEALREARIIATRRFARPGYGNIFEESVGRYDNVRVVMARNNVSGFLTQGWTLIGTPREEVKYPHVKQ